MKKIVGCVLTILCISCSGSDDSTDETPVPMVNAPVATNYIVPVNNAVCTGEELSETEISVNFNWNPFQDVEDSNLTYTFSLQNLSTNTTVASETLSETNTNYVLEKGVSYSWNITATDSDNNATTGATWQFQTPFNAISNHVPFPATMMSPDNGETINSNSVTFIWEGNDPDAGETEQLTYALYVETANPPTVVVADMLTVATYTETFEAGIYYWKVTSTDPSGNISNSEVRQFIIE